jgi:radical SAM protein with 4Fe4S-binding SPASM domain
MIQQPKVFSIGFHVGIKTPYFIDIPIEDCIDYEVAIKALKLLSTLIPNDDSSKTISMYFGGGCSLKHFNLIKNIYNYVLDNPICKGQFIALDVSTDGKDINYEFLNWLQLINKNSFDSGIAFSIRTSHKNINNIIHIFNAYRNLIANPYGMSCVAYYVDKDLDINTILKDLEKLAIFGFCNCLILPSNTYCSALMSTEEDNKWSEIFRKSINWYLSIRNSTNFRICLYDRYYKLITLGKQNKSWFSQCGIFLDSTYSHIYVLSNGLVYPCSGAPYAGEYYSIGSVDTGFNWEKIEQLRKNISKHCSSCSISDYCFKGCYIVEKPNGRENNHNNRFSCKMQKIIFDEIKKGVTI